MSTVPADGLRNLQGETDYDIVWPWTRPGGLRNGSTAVLRVKNEARSLPWVLPGLLRVCDKVLIVDNQSDDGTGEVAKQTAVDMGRGEALDVLEYPFRVARAGAEHLAEPELSLHSLSYFYNWSFAQVDTTFSWKWDGDMVLTAEGELAMAEFGWRSFRKDVILKFPRHGLYVESDRRAHLDLSLHNAEGWGFPIGPDWTYTKSFEWEVRRRPEDTVDAILPRGLCVELKYLDGDEFGHWTDPESFATSARNARKRYEWSVFNALTSGEVPEELITIDAPEGTHIIDYVTKTWLPTAPRPLKPPNRAGDRALEVP